MTEKGITGPQSGDTKSYLPDFLESIQDTNKKELYKKTIEKLPLNHEDLTRYSQMKLEQMIAETQPTTTKDITMTAAAVRALVQYQIENDPNASKSVLRQLNNLNRQNVWLMSKMEHGQRKYISKSEYESVQGDIEKYGVANLGKSKKSDAPFEMTMANAESYSLLWRCIWEGVFTPDSDYYGLQRLRASEIEDNTVLVHGGEEDFRLEVSEDLINGIRQEAVKTTWDRNNKYGTFTHLAAVGTAGDAAFKLEIRNTGKVVPNWRQGIYARFLRIVKGHLDWDLSPTQLWISGIVSRCFDKLKEAGIDPRDVFAVGARNKQAAEIIKAELDRCHCKIPYGDFRTQIMPYVSDLID